MIKAKCSLEWRKTPGDTTSCEVTFLTHVMGQSTLIIQQNGGRKVVLYLDIDEAKGLLKQMTEELESP